MRSTPTLPESDRLEDGQLALMRILLDTHVLVYWVSSPELLSPAPQHAVQSISPRAAAVVADIALWEIAMLVSGGRMAIDLRLRDWENRDPADRLIVATAMVYGCHLFTNDRTIRESNLVSVG